MSRFSTIACPSYRPVTNQNSRLLHDKRGVLSMANSGRDTNRSQFFITFKATRHLDNQHTVFGRVVGGLDTLARMEASEVDKVRASFMTRAWWHAFMHAWWCARRLG